METPLSKDSSNIVMEFTNMIIRYDSGMGIGSKSMAIGLKEDALNQWVQTVSKDKKTLFNLLHRALTQILPLITKETLLIRYCMALDWIEKSFKISVSSFVESVPYLQKSMSESFDAYVIRIERTIQKLNSFGISKGVLESIYNAYRYNLTSVYLPTKYFPELKKGEFEYFPSALSAVLDDPYPRSVSEWKERIGMANRLVEGMDEEENPFLWELEIPNVDAMIRRNKSPAVASSLPLTSQLLSEEAMMAMVKKWDVREKFFIRIGTFLRKVNDEEPLTLLDTMFAPFFHGLTQYFATKGQIAPMIDDKYKTLYRGLRPVAGADMVDLLFPMDELGNRRSYKEKGIIATSFTRGVAEEYYTKPVMLSSNQMKRGLLMIVDIQGSKGPIPIAPISHTTDQDEVLLLPGTFTFVNHMEAKADYDVILVRYTPDLTMMKLFPGVYDVYQKRIEGLGTAVVGSGGSKKKRGTIGRGRKVK